MKLSELNYQNLSEQDKYNLIMYDVNTTPDYSKLRSDGIVVLGSSPLPLYDRILKLEELFINNVSKNIFLSGGTGWHKYWQSDESKKQELTKKISDIFGENYSSFSNYLKELLIEMRTSLTEAQLMLLFLGKYGIINEENANIYLERKSNNTNENAEYTKAMIDKLLSTGELEQCLDLIVITTSWHARRSYATFKKYFEKENISVIPSTNDLIRNHISLNDDSYYNYYHDKISNECQKLITYSSNNWIVDLDINTFLPEDTIYNIEKNQRDGLKKPKIYIKK